MPPENMNGNDALWYKDAIVYELHVRAFRDSNSDGIGDFRGLIEKLDYIASLGVTAIWILPFFPSPLKDDGYDIADYYGIHKDYGTLRDFKKLINAAHALGIKVIIELVLNHTSNQHPWFQRARIEKGDTEARRFYVWSDNPNTYKDARVIFKDFESSNWSFDSVAQAYYWHRFYSHQPDLNYDNPAVQKEMFRVIEFWFDLGVDGLRLDAVPYLFEAEDTNCENLPQTHRFLKKLRAHVDAHFKNKMLIGEANQWPEDAAAYFGKGDECHMAFHFPLMPRLFMAVQMEDSFPIIDILKSTPKVPGTCQWAMFLRNHDELTLEMVTDEERDYMNRMYAQDPRMRINQGIRRRFAPLLSNNRRKIELMNMLLFSFPGTPVLYYGDEIGMGDNYYLGDRNGVRTPMQWNTGKNAGFSEANPHKLYLPIIIDPQYHYEAVNVENQEENLTTQLWWMRRVIIMRKRFACFGRGDIAFIASNNAKVISFVRLYEDEIVLVVANLSRFMQVVMLELAQYSGYVPVEVFSKNPLPIVKEEPYVLTLGPYGHYWLQLTKVENLYSLSDKNPPVLKTAKKWHTLLDGESRATLTDEILPMYLKSCSWFQGNNRIVRMIEIEEVIPVHDTFLIILSVNYNEGLEELYTLPVTFIEKGGYSPVYEKYPQGIICGCVVGKRSGYLFDAVYHTAFQHNLLSVLIKKNTSGRASAMMSSIQNKKIYQHSFQSIKSTQVIFKEYQKNSTIKYDDAFFLKLYRKIEAGVHPEVETGHFISEKTRFSNIPPYVGAIHYSRRDDERYTLALVQKYVTNVTDAWRYTQDSLTHYFERIISEKPVLTDTAADQERPGEKKSVSQAIREIAGSAYLEFAAKLGTRTAEMHHAFYSIGHLPSFAREPFSLLYQHAVYQSIHSTLTRSIQLLGNKQKGVDETIILTGKEILSREKEILSVLKPLTRKKIDTIKIRIHGNYHLSQILLTGKDLCIIDFEGLAERSFNERRLCYSAFRDVASMLHSFYSAPFSILFHSTIFRPEDHAVLAQWIDPWYQSVSSAFLDSYLATIGNSPIVPRGERDREILFTALFLEKMLYDICQKLKYHPAWVIIPFKGVKRILDNRA